jgi:hypothetical protein
MGIDYIVDLDCVPKRALTVEGLMSRLKGRDRAEKIIQLYREQGDLRPPQRMAFEMVRRLPDGSEEVELIVVQHLLDAAQELMPWEADCAGCLANAGGQPFGCTGTINYPLSEAGERWLLQQLPDGEHPLIFMLLGRALRDMGYSGEHGAALRAQPGVFLTSAQAPARNLGALTISGDQVFEMLFLSGPIYPAHGALLLQFFGAMPPDLDADVMMQLADPPSGAWIDARLPFLHTPDPRDDPTIAALKMFFYALYVAYCLGVPLLLDV